MSLFDIVSAKIEEIPTHQIVGSVAGVRGNTVEIRGLTPLVCLGDRCIAQRSPGSPGSSASPPPLALEVVAIEHEAAFALPYGPLGGVGPGMRVTLQRHTPALRPHPTWLGRVLNAFGGAIDGGPPLLYGPRDYVLASSPPAAAQRRPLGPKLPLSIRALDTFTPCCRGQRMGIFSGSGVGKSILLGQIARFARADIIVLGLIGERGREVREFLDVHLGEAGKKRTVAIVSTAEEMALTRRLAATTAMTVAEYFRDQGASVLLLMDSLTRFAMAQREIGLSAGEPPSSRGYTPTVFALLPNLLERAGPGMEKSTQGDITGLFTVLVEGDDENEPISDAVRGILDGHIMLSREIAQRRRFPAIDILKSVSRALPRCNHERENHLLARALSLMATYERMRELIQLGAYRQGSDPAIDKAIHYQPALEKFIEQSPDERADAAGNFEALAKILERAP